MATQSSTRKPSSTIAAAVGGVVVGAVTGALIGSTISGIQAILVGAILGALYFGLVEAITDARRRPGEPKPLWHRIVSATLVGGALAAFLSLLFPGLGLTLIGLIIGSVTGLHGLGSRKLALGVLIGLAAGFLATELSPGFNPAVLGMGVVLVHRSVLALFLDDTEPVQLSGERVPPHEAKYVVPFEAQTKRIGADYFKTLARASDGSYKRNRPGIGIVETMEALKGPHFDPSLVDPLIREFYEHTSRFRLSIEPAWNPLMKPLFWFFKTSIAQPIGQANLPFNTEEAQRGMVSYIDTIDYGSADYIRTLRGWTRAYADSDEAIYVGIYTVVRHDDIGYVSVGFPLPEANWTVTLLPYNHRHSDRHGDHQIKPGDFLLKTQNTGLSFPGHYLTFFENETGTKGRGSGSSSEPEDGQSLTILKLPTMGEEIDVYVQEGQLRTDHRFYFGRYRFLTLYYTIERIDGATGSA